MHVESAIRRAGSVRKLAEILGVSTQAVYKMRKKGALAPQHAKAVRENTEVALRK